MHALAVRRPSGDGLRFGHTAAEIGAHAGLATNTVSAQIDVLEREGLVEKTPRTAAPSTASPSNCFASGCRCAPPAASARASPG